MKVYWGRVYLGNTTYGVITNFNGAYFFRIKT